MQNNELGALTLKEQDLKEAENAKRQRRKVRWIRAFRFIRSNKKLLFGGICVLFMVIIALFAEQIAPYGYADINTGSRFERPSAEHLFGTDNLQRDVFSRVVYGARISLKVGLVCVVIAVGIGIPLGLLAGYVGGWVDLILSRVSDILLAVPWVLMAVAVTAVVGPGITVVYIAMGFVHTPGFMRIARSMTLSIREREYVDAARQMGEGRASILFRQILPNISGTLIVRATSIMAGAILSEAAISYLGYGTQPPMPSWGLMLTDSQGYLWQAPYLAVFPGLAIAWLVFSINMFGDGLRDLLDPRYKGKAMN